jgi:hypothetical protein
VFTGSCFKHVKYWSYGMHVQICFVYVYTRIFYTLYFSYVHIHMYTHTYIHTRIFLYIHENSMCSFMNMFLYIGRGLCMFNTQNGVLLCIIYTKFCRCHIIRIMKYSCIIQMYVLIRYISQEILQYVLIQILNKHT